MFLGLGLPIARRGFLTPVEPFAGILDQLGTAPFAAYSLRLLTADYAGAAIRVRRSSDNAETDIGFTGAGLLDTTALLAHCGAGDGFVVTWYDQVGAKDFKQATAGSQPRIVASGVVDVKNGVPMLRLLSNARAMWTDAFTAYTGTTLAIAAAASLASGNAFFRRFVGAWNGTNDTAGSAAILILAENATPATGFTTYRGGAPRSTVAADLDGVNIVWSRYDGVDGLIETEAASGSAGAITDSFSVVRFTLSTDSVSSASFAVDGSIGEAVIFGTLPSSGDEDALRADMADFYGA